MSDIRFQYDGEDNATYRLFDSSAKVSVQGSNLYLAPSNDAYESLTHGLFTASEDVCGLQKYGLNAGLSGISAFGAEDTPLSVLGNASLSAEYTGQDSMFAATRDWTNSAFVNTPSCSTELCQPSYLTGLGAQSSEVQCLIDVSAPMHGLGEDLALPALSQQSIEYGIVRSSTQMALSFGNEVVSLGANQGVYIKNNSLYADPINFVNRDSPFAISIDSNGHLNAKSNWEYPSSVASIVSGPLTAAADNVSSIIWNQVSVGYGGNQLDTFRLKDQFVSLTNDYGAMLIPSVPKGLLARATDGYLAEASLIAVSCLQAEDAREEVVERFEKSKEADEIESLLHRLNPDFVPMYRGAVDALNSGNSDRARHFSVSIRELISRVLRCLAPDDEVRAWRTDDELYHEGRPTRRARLLYITRDLGFGPFDDFLQTKIKSTIEFYNLFNRGTHDVVPGFSDSQLKMMKHETDETIRMLLPK